MDRNWKKLTQRLFALLLCVAMVLPMLPQPVHASKVASFIPVDPATVKLPTYATSSGKVSELFEYDCGNGVENNGATSGMKIVTGTNASEFATYCEALKTELGDPVYTKEFNDNSGGSNTFRKYMAKDGSYSVYAYFLPAYSEARIIIDTHRDTVEGYQYEAGETVTTPKMVMYGLSMSPNGYHLETSTGLSTDRENNGALIIIRMKDNSLFINDGGILGQMSEAMAAELLEFCRELTGTKGTNKKMVINTWFLSHAHDDHFQGFTRFMNINHEHFDLKNIMYNIDIERVDPTRDIHDAMQLIRQHYPDVRYYKPHTGEKIDVAGIKFDVMLTHEDRLIPGTDGVIDVFEGDEGTFRDGTYTDTAKTKSDFNDTSTVVRVNFENGVDSILYADMNKAEGILRTIHPQGTLDTEIMLVPHHGFDPHRELVTISNSKIFLYTQHKQAIYGTDDDVTTNDLFGTSRDESGGRMKGNFVTMFPGMNVPKGETPNVDYKIYWGGNETAIIDIEKLASATTTTAIGNCVETRKAINFKYTGWTIDSLTDDETLGVKPTGTVSTVGSANTANKNFAYQPVSDATLSTSGRNGALVQDGRYLFMSKDQKYVMSYQAATTGTSGYPAHAAGSLLRDDSGKTDGSFAIGGDGSVYLDHADRDLATWVLRQFKEATGGTSIGNEQKLQNIRWTNFASSVTESTKNPIYQGIELQKGIYGPDGVTSNGVTTRGYFWDTKASDQRFPFFNYSSFRQPFYQYTAGTDQNPAERIRFCLEAFKDGTYVFYYKVNDAGTDFRVIMCDEYGNWGVRRYCALDGTDATKGAYPIDQMRGDLEKLKIRLYRYIEGGNIKNVALEGYAAYNVDIGSDVDNIVKSIQYNSRVYDTSTQHPVAGNGTVAKRNSYHVDVSAVNTNEVGTYNVPVYYSSQQGAAVQIATIKVNVTKTVTGKSGVVSHNAYDTMKVHPDVNTKEAVTFMYAGEAIDITVGMLTDANGKKVDTSKPGTYTGLKVTYNGLVIAKGFTLTVAEDTLLIDELGIVKVGKGSTTSDAQFSATGVANIQLTASAGLYQKPVDLIFIVDLSSSMRYATDGSTELTGSPWNPNGTANNTEPQEKEVNGWFDETVWPDTRLYALEESLMDMVETLQRNDADVRIAIADFGDLDHYEFNKAVADTNYRNWPYLDANRSGGSNSGDIPWEPANQLNFILGKDDEASKIEGKQSHFISQPFLLNINKYRTNEYYYTGKCDPKVFTGSGKVDADAFQDVDTLNLLGTGTLVHPGTGSLVEDLNKQNGKLLGTNYDVGLETAYRLAKARQDANVADGLDREIVCIFMSDGAAMQYNYFSGRSLTEAWSQYLIGETDEILENFKGATETVTDANDQETTVDVGAFSFSWDEPEKWPTRLYKLTGEMHQRLAFGNLDKDANGNHFSKCAHQHDYVNAPGGQAFFQCLNGQMAGYWDTFFRVLYFNSNGDSDDIGIGDSVNGYLYPDLPVSGTGNNYKGAQFRKDLISELRQPNYHTVQATTDVNNDGVVDEKDTETVQYQYQTYSPYYYFYHTEGKNWWAEAIKGDPNKVYPVVNRFAYTTDAEGNKVYASGAKKPDSWDTNFYNGEDGCHNNFVSTEKQGNTTKYKDANGNLQSLALEGKDGISGFKGLGLDLYTIGFSMASENRISADEANEVLAEVCSGASFQKNANSQAELTQVLNQIISSTASPATGAYFTDTMGEEFDLSTEKTVIHRDGKEITVNAQPTIRVLEYKLDLYGNRVGDPTVIETITFEGGKVAKSDLVYTTTTDANGVETKTYTDIWDDTTGLITGKHVIYNTNTDKAVDLYLDDSGRKFPLAAETFFWIVGRLDEDQVVLEYQAHLTGSTEGTRMGLMQSYATNASAVLYYNDYLGHLADKGTESPVFDWATDMIVVDYGIPVSVGVPNKYTDTNEVIGVHAGGDLPGVTTKNPANLGYKSSVEGKYGTMELLDGKMKYTPNTMDFTGTDSFAYAIKGDGETYYSVVHVVPATTIYYEDAFVKLETATKEKFPVVVRVPEDWEDVYLYSWNADGVWDQAWPGTMMQKLADHTYCAYVSADQTGLIIAHKISGDGDTVTYGQTVNVPIDYETAKNGVWIDVSEYTVISEDKPCHDIRYTTYDGFLPKAPASTDPAKVPVVVKAPHGWSTVHMHSWKTGEGTTWPGDAMKSLGDGWYYGYVYKDRTGIVVNNGQGAPQTEDVTVDLSNASEGAWIVISENTDANAHYIIRPLIYEAALPTAPAYEDAYYTVHVQLPSTWDGGCVWAWDQESVYDKWPGRYLKDEGNGWWTTDIPAFAKNYLFVTTDGKTQTGNINGTGTEQWIVIGSDLKTTVTDTAPSGYYPTDAGSVIMEGGWTTVGTTGTSGQDEDRPGAVTEALKGLDADSIYGYDNNYTTMPSYSYGSAVMTNVNSDRYASAKFSFTGTGFDVISLTSADTGVIVVKITDEDGYVANYLVDTYYGYKFAGGKWVVDTDASDNAIYQVPVIKVDMTKIVKDKDDPNTTKDETTYFGYGKYDVEIVATYADLFDHQQCDCTSECSGCYDFYLDAIRIYDPANDGVDDEIVEYAYIEDDEYKPTYEELRNMLIGVEEFNSLGDQESAGIVFIDGNADLSDEEGNGGSEEIPGVSKPGVTEYANYGPNNELYLAKDQAVAFALNTVTDLNKVHLALKSFDGTAEVTIYGVDANGGKNYVFNDKKIDSTTDLYYDITDLVGTTVVIRNTGASGVLSITNLKSTYVKSEEVSSEDVESVATVSMMSVQLALASMEGEEVPVEPVDGDIVLKGATLSFEDELLMNIYFELDQLDVEPEDLGLITFTSEMTNGTIDDADAVIPGAVAGSNGRYMVRTKGIAAKEMGDTIYFRVYAKLADGSYVYSDMRNYSAKEYAMSILAKSENEQMKALVVAMLNYGAAAQSYFGYRTDALVNSDLTAEQKALVKDYSAELVADVAAVDETKAGAFIANGGFGTKRPTVSLNDAFAINYYLDKSYPADGDTKLYYWMQEDFEAAEVLTAENATGVLVNGITVGGIPAKGLNRAVYVAAVYEHDDVTYCTGVLPYSIGTYCAGLADEFEYARAMVVYGSHAEDYFG